MTQNVSCLAGSHYIGVVIRVEPYCRALGQDASKFRKSGEVISGTTVFNLYVILQSFTRFPVTIWKLFCLKEKHLIDLEKIYPKLVLSAGLWQNQNTLFVIMIRILSQYKNALSCSIP